MWGSLTSSLVEKRLICKQIVEHLLNHHFNIEQTEIQYTAAQMDAAFAVNECFRDFLEGNNNSENMAIQVVKTFDELGKNLRSLDELPLVITSVLGTFFKNRNLYTILQQKSNISFNHRSIASFSILRIDSRYRKRSTIFKRRQRNL